MPIGLRIFMAIEVTLCYLPGLQLRFYPFSSQMSSKQKKIIKIVYTMFTLFNALILFALVREFESSTMLIRLNMLVFQFFLVAANVMIIKGYWREHLFTFGLVAICMYMLLSTATYLSQFFFVENRVYQYMTGTAFYIVFMIIWYSQIRLLLKKNILPFLSRKCADYWKQVWFIPLLLYVTMFIALPLDQNIRSLTLLFGRLFISVVGVVFVRVVAANQKMLLETEAMEEQIDRSRLHYAEMQSQVEATRKVRHDLKHILNSVRHYIETNDKSGLSDFCDSIEEMQMQKEKLPYTGCAAVDGVLYHYEKRAKAYQIDFKFQGRFANIDISELDLCVLIGNALENAFDACLTIEENRFVILTSGRDGDLLSIMVQNSFDGKMNVDVEKIFSRKSENRIGVGLESMRSICEKYGGSMKNEWNASTFTNFMILNAKMK